MEILLFILVGGLIVGLLKNFLITTKKDISPPDSYDTHWTSEKKKRQKKHSERVKASQKRSKNHHPKMNEIEKIIEVSRTRPGSYERRRRRKLEEQQRDL